MTLPEDRRHIYLHMLMPNPGSIVFTLDNTFNGHFPAVNDEGQVISSKHMGHGTGLDSVKNIVNRYNGVLKTNTKEDMFCVSIVLNL